VLLIVKMVSNKRRRTWTNLSQRFQVRENVLLSTTMLPLMILCFLFQMAITPFLFLHKLGPEQHRDLFLAIFLVGTALFPFAFGVFLLRSEAMRKALEIANIVAMK
ncbi:hypothetical protein PFISCL1PPCAC_12708, partial [Pristionchus fissidentatus]